VGKLSDRIDTFGAKGLSAADFPSLTRVTINDSSRIDWRVFDWDDAPRLESLNVDGCFMIDDSFIGALNP
jgi:hypothetical protein